LDTTRVLIAIILSLALVVAYQELVLKRFYPPPTEKTAAGAPKGTLSAMPSAAATAALEAGVPVAAAPAEVAGAPERIIEVSTDLYTADFTTRGARLKSFRLKRYSETAARSSRPYDVVRPSPHGHLPLSAVFMRGSEVLSDNALSYSTDAPARVDLDAHGEVTINFTAETADGAKIEKTFTLRAGSYAFDMAVSVSGGAPPVALGIGMSRSLAEGAGYRDIPELQADVNNKVTTESESALRKGVAPIEGAMTYAGFGDQYFLAAFLPESPRSGMLQMAYTGDEAIANLLFPGAARVTSRVYIGPKLLEALEAVDPALHNAIDFGWTGPLALAFLRLLKLFHRIAPNYGVDIILLTLLVRILLLPMSIRSQRSMMKMQRLQPQLERLREKFKDDQERLQKEMVELYRRNHVNPLGGCAPMALQFPIFIALYYALRYAVELRHAPFIGWIKDLSAPDCLEIPAMPVLPYIQCHGLPVLVLLMGLSTFVQQWMSPTTPDPNQQRMMMLTPVVFTIMLVNFPAGLSLYYFASNVLGIIQQFVLNREFKQFSPVTA
jgi:YidC/Oxa1 family membrane protein insertase